MALHEHRPQKHQVRSQKGGEHKSNAENDNGSNLVTMNSEVIISGKMAGTTLLFLRIWLE